jgi:hypothetical protein
MAKVKLQIAHQVPGRVRMKIPSAKGNTELLQEIGNAFGQIPGIEHISVNPVTGSVVLHYDTERHDEFHGGLQRHCGRNGQNGRNGHNGIRPPDTEIDTLANKIEDQAEFLAEHSHSARAIVDFCKKLDRDIKSATQNNLDLKLILALGIIGVTVFEVGATAATPVWVTLSLFAMNHFIELHQHPQARQAATSAPIIVKRGMVKGADSLAAI